MQYPIWHHDNSNTKRNKNSITNRSDHNYGDGDDGNRHSCPICESTGYIDSWRTTICSFCNGTKEHTKAAERFMKVHPCQCIHSDRENCPLCKQRCHHSTNNKPKVLIVRSPPPPPSSPRWKG